MVIVYFAIIAMTKYLPCISVRQGRASSVDIAYLDVMLLVLNLDLSSATQTRSFDGGHNNVGMGVDVESGRRGAKFKYPCFLWEKIVLNLH